MVKPRVDWFKQGGDIHSLKMISWGIRKSANHAPTWLILPSGRKDKRQNSSDSGEIYSDRLLWRMSVVFNHCLRVICPDYPAHRALNHPGLTWFGDDCHWYFCINVHTWAKSSKKQTTAGCGFKTSSMVSLLLEKDDSNKSLPIYLGQMESRSICLVLMISAWLKPNQAYMTSCCQGHGSSHRLVTWPCLWSFGSHSVLEIKWLKNQPSIVLPIGSMENMYIYQPLVDLFMVNVCKCRCIYNNIYTSPMDPMGIFQSSTIWLSSFRASLANMWSLDFHQFRVSENVPNKKRKEIDWTSIVFLVSSVCVCVSVFLIHTIGKD